MSSVEEQGKSCWSTWCFCLFASNNVDKLPKSPPITPNLPLAKTPEYPPIDERIQKMIAHRKLNSSDKYSWGSMLRLDNQDNQAIADTPRPLNTARPNTFLGTFTQPPFGTP